MTNKKILWVAIIVAVLGLSGIARADSIGGINNVNCPGNDCFGTLYTLTFGGAPISSTATTETFQITLSADTTNTSFGSGDWIDAVAIKVSPSASSFTLVSAPGGTSAWPNQQLGGLNSSGCDGSGSGFVCVEDGTGDTVAGPATLPFAGTYAWTFDVTIPTGTLMTGPFGPSIKVLYTDVGTCHKHGVTVPCEKNLGITSEDITLQKIPEPATLALFGSGLIAVSGLVRRKLRKQPRV